VTRRLENWWLQLRKTLHCGMRRGEPLASHTTYRVGGPSEAMIWIDSEASLTAAIRCLDSHHVPWRVLGGGSNLLVSDAGWSGVVLHLQGALSGLRIFEKRSKDVIVEAGGGTPLPQLLFWAQRRGFQGLERVAGIPGTVGGAVKMNAGTREGSMGDCLTEVRLWSRGRLSWVPAESLRFSYRTSNIGPRRVVAAVRMRLKLTKPELVRRRMIALLKKRRSSQPWGVFSAGCFFKNPPGESAGRLLDRAGCKGQRQGVAVVSERHANFIVHDGGASSRDIWILAKRVAQMVRIRSGVRLQREVELWGNFSKTGKRG
jgi:UDP-N-acetylmuramate dehydrogenase